MTYPRISIVTPSYNQADYLEQTILSVINQNYPNLEYIIIDGGSTDGSVNIIRRYESYLAYWVSEPDKGMYDALLKGFTLTTGEIMAWINSDDMYHSRSLFTVADVFRSNPNVKWLTGCPSTFDEMGRTAIVEPVTRWSKYRFYLNDFQWIQQESTFWHRTLWEQAGSYIDSSLRFAADYELWLRFFRYQKLYSVDTILGGYRARLKNQLSLDFYLDYIQEVEQTLKKEVIPKDAQKVIDRIKLYQKYFLKNSLLRNNPTILNKYNRLWGYPQLIHFNRYNQTFELT